MIAVRDIFMGLYGAARLAMGDRTGAFVFGTEAQDFWRSFFAAVLSFPAYALLLALGGAERGFPEPLWRFVAVEFMTYVIGWLAFPWVMASVTATMGVPERWVRFVVAHNWAAVIQITVFLFFRAVAAIGFLPHPGNSLLLAAATTLLFVYEWWIAKATLDVPGALAAMVVVVQVAVAVAVILLGAIFF